MGFAPSLPELLVLCSGLDRVGAVKGLQLAADRHGVALVGRSELVDGAEGSATEATSAKTAPAIRPQGASQATAARSCGVTPAGRGR